jgi:allophanate hydrolase subunit 1
VGQTAFRTFRPEAERPFALSPGDELVFPSVSEAELEKIRQSDDTGNGGADSEVLE